MLKEQLWAAAHISNIRLDRGVLQVQKYLAQKARLAHWKHKVVISGGLSQTAPPANPQRKGALAQRAGILSGLPFLLDFGRNHSVELTGNAEAVFPFRGEFFHLTPP